MEIKGEFKLFLQPAFKVEDLSKAIVETTENYELYSQNAKNFFYSDNKTEIIKEALNN